MRSSEGTLAIPDHTVPGVTGLFTCGASTAPVGGISGSSGKAAALKARSPRRESHDPRRAGRAGAPSTST
jgi:phytoene dehydrogenase-like protein